MWTMALRRATCAGVDLLLSLKKWYGSFGNWLVLFLLVLVSTGLAGAEVEFESLAGVDGGTGTGAVVIKVFRAKAWKRWSSGALSGKGVLPSQSWNTLPSRGVPSLV
jgi:hypothetical protein